MSELAQKMEVGPGFIRAAVVPETVNVENRTVEVVFGTEVKGRRRHWLRGTYYEQLSFSSEHVRLGRLSSGNAPALDNHDYWSSVTKSVVGVVSSASVGNGEGRCTIRFSKRADVEPLWLDVKDGIIRNVSVGYNVYAYEVTEFEDQPDLYRAVDWEPMEVSVVPVPFDEGAFIRSAEAEQKKDIFKNVKLIRKMAEEKNTATPTPQAPANDGVNVDAARTQVPATPTPPANQPPTPPAGPSADEIRAQERQRVIDITEAVRAANLGSEFADTLIKDGASIDAARKMIIDKWKEAGAPAQRGQEVDARLGDGDEIDKTRQAVTDAILFRAGSLMKNGKPVYDMPENARRFNGLTMVDLARQAYERGGGDAKGLSRYEIVKRAMTTRSLHSTSDFPIILGNTVNRVLRDMYQLQERTFMPFCTRTTASDFKEQTRAQLSHMVKGFEKVVEGAEYKRDSMNEAKEAYSLEKYGRIIALTWEAMVNDDLSAFNRIPRAIAAQAAQKQSDIVYNILNNNPTMGDGVALFAAGHGNLAGSGAAISETTLSAARKAMRLQTGLNNKDVLNLVGRYLLVSPSRETEAQKIINAVIMATKSADTNVFQGSYEVIVESRLEQTNNPWYLIAQPNVIDTIEYAFLEGEGELFTEQKEGFDVDGLEIKARMVFAAKAIDHRGMYKNPGA